MKADQGILNEKLFGLIGDLAALESTTGVPSFLRHLTGVYGIKSAAYLGVGLAGRRDGDPLVAATYSHDWVSHYRAREYQRIDPVIQIGMRRLLPIDWNDFDNCNRAVKVLFGEASEFGLGKHGLSIPVHAQAGTWSLLSITSDMPRRDWERLRHYHMRDLQVLATHLHALVLRTEGHALPERLLSQRERECLHWIAAGKTIWECAIILGLAKCTVRSYLESARSKLEATSNTHAVSKALTAGLLSKGL